MDEFSPYSSKNGSFIVRNINYEHKVIKIFNYPILWGTTRNIKKIPGVSGADIRASLESGELSHKIRANDIVIEYSDIDLLEFNNDQRLFLKNAGVTIGTQINFNNLDVLRHEDIILLGVIDGVNTFYNIPPIHSAFIQTDVYKIRVYLNGVKQLFNGDFFIEESGGAGTGFDTIIMAVAPINDPIPIDILTADFYTLNI